MTGRTLLHPQALYLPDWGRGGCRGRVRKCKNGERESEQRTSEGSSIICRHNRDLFCVSTQMHRLHLCSHTLTHTQRDRTVIVICSYPPYLQVSCSCDIKRNFLLLFLPSFTPSLPPPLTDGQFRHIKTGERFVFNAREDLHRWNQKRYEALGEVTHSTFPSSAGMRNINAGLRKLALGLEHITSISLGFSFLTNTFYNVQ